MRNLTLLDIRSGHPRSSLFGLRLALLVALLLAISVPVLAQEAASAPLAALEERLADQWEVLPADGGLLLRAIEPIRGIKTVELRGERLAINGQAVEQSVLAVWLGEDAAPVLELAALSADQKASLFGFVVPQTEETNLPDSETSSGLQVEMTGDEDAEDGPMVEAPEAPETPEARANDARSRSSRPSIRITTDDAIAGDTVVIDEGEVVDKVVSYESLIVRGRVRDDAFSFGGSAEIDGEIGGDFTAMNTAVRLGPDADINGNLLILGGSLELDPEARIGGKVSRLGDGNEEFGKHVSRIEDEIRRGFKESLRDGFSDSDDWFRPRRFRGLTFATFFGQIFELIFVGLLVLLVMVVGRDSIERLERSIQAEPGKTILIGLIASLLFLPAFVLVVVVLALSIVGIPLLILMPFALVLLVLLAFVAYVAGLYRLGRWVGKRFSWTLTPYAAAFVGLLAVYLPLVLGRFLDIFGGPTAFFAAMFSFLGGVLHLGVMFAGFGAGILWLADWRRKRKENANGSTIPPAPMVPPSPAGADNWSESSNWDEAPRWPEEPGDGPEDDFTASVDPAVPDGDGDELEAASESERDDAATDSSAAADPQAAEDDDEAEADR